MASAPSLRSFFVFGEICRYIAAICRYIGAICRFIIIVAGNAHGQDEANPTFRLATRAVKMELYLARSGLPVTRAPLFTVNLYNKSFIGQVCSVKMAGF